jgi:predicted helicase
MGWIKIVPNEAGDWLNQRSEAFAGLIPLGDKADKINNNTFFVPHYSNGVKTNRDTWCYNYSEKSLISNIRNSISFYNGQVEEFASGKAKNPSLTIEDGLVWDSKLFSWDAQQKVDVQKGEKYLYDKNSVVVSLYRPYQKQCCYFNRKLNNRVYKLPDLFPTQDNPNQVICVSAFSDGQPLISGCIPDLHFNGDCQCFPLYWYEKEGGDSRRLFSSAQGNGKVINGYIRHDGITDWILAECKKLYAKEIPRMSKSQIFHYVYGILHAQNYRETFSIDLKKSLPRIPLVPKARDFLACVEAGKALAKLHLGYETVNPYPAKVIGADAGRFQVEKMRFGKDADGKVDRTVIQYSSLVRIENIPLEAYGYIVNGKSAIDWIMERYQIKSDKDSGILNDPNDWAKEHREPKYILDLILRVITVSLETLQIVKGLSEITF